MCDTGNSENNSGLGLRTIPIEEAVGTVLAHDITEIRQGEFKGRAFRKGHVVRREDVCHLQRLGKERLYVLDVASDEMHENDAAYALAEAVMGEGVEMQGEPKEGKINLIAGRDGLLKIDKEALLEFNMLGEVMCATLHSNTVVKKGRVVAGTRAIPLVVKRAVVEEAGRRSRSGFGARGAGIVQVKELRKPKAGVVITGNEVYYGRIRDAFAPIVEKKIKDVGGEIIGTYYAPDDASHIEARLRELINAGADLLITTGGMSVDPDDVTRFAIRNMGVADIHYGSAVLPGAMILVTHVKGRNGNGNKSDPQFQIPVLGIPACGMYHKTTVFDLILPRILAGDDIGRKELAELGYGGLCLHCRECQYPVCPFGK